MIVQHHLFIVPPLPIPIFYLIWFRCLFLCQVSVAARVRSIDHQGNSGSRDANTVVLRTPPGSLLGGAADLGIATGLPFHLDAPFFVKDSGPHRPIRSLVFTTETNALAAEWQQPPLPGAGGGHNGNNGNNSNSGHGSHGGSYMTPEQRKIAAAERASAGRIGNERGVRSGYPSDSSPHGSFGMSLEAEHAVGKWNEALLEAAMLELVPTLLADLRDALRPK